MPHIWNSLSTIVAIYQQCHAMCGLMAVAVFGRWGKERVKCVLACDSRGVISLGRFGYGMPEACSTRSSVCVCACVSHCQNRIDMDKPSQIGVDNENMKHGRQTMDRGGDKSTAISNHFAFEIQLIRLMVRHFHSTN